MASEKHRQRGEKIEKPQRDPSLLPMLPVTGGTPAPQKAPPTPGSLSQWNVVLHNDEENELGYVVEVVTLLTTLTKNDAVMRTQEAHNSGTSVLLTTHRERAELYVEQFASKNLTVSIEPTSF